jgi:hypothetical protein
VAAFSVISKAMAESRSEQIKDELQREGIPIGMITTSHIASDINSFMLEITSYRAPDIDKARTVLTSSGLLHDKPFAGV